MSNILHETTNPDFPSVNIKSADVNSTRVSQMAHIETSAKVPNIRLLLICNAEEMLTRYSDIGYIDSGLTARGWEQANRLASWLKTHEKIDSLLCGSQLHSRFTAQRIGYALGLSVHIEPALATMTEYSEAVRETVAERDPSRVKQSVQSTLASLHASTRPSTTATSPEVKSVLEYLDQLHQSHTGAAIAIVINRYSIAQLLSGIMGGNLEITLEHTGITELSRYHDHWVLNYVNRSEHRPLPQIVPISTPGSEQNDEGNASSIGASTEPREQLQSIKHIYNNALCVGGDLIDQAQQQRIQHLLNFAHLSGDMQCLDLGTGTGLLPLLLAESGASEAIGIDISPAMLECAEYLRLSNPTHYIRHVNYRLARAQWLPFHQERFHTVTCRMILHLSYKPEIIVQEGMRVLKADGTFLLAELLSADDPVKRATQNVIEERRNPCHVAARSLEYYRKLLTNVGLTIQEEEIAIFERELEEWLDELQASEDVRSTVREMMEAGLEADAAGINLRRENGQLLFDQRLVYLKAVKA